MKYILVIENFSEDCCNSIESIASIFQSNHWLIVSCQGPSISLNKCDERFKSAQTLKRFHRTLDFYRKLTSIYPNTIVIRVRNPIYPLHSGLYTEIQEQFPESNFHYVLSTGEECGLSGYFVERFNRSFLDQLPESRVPIMPPGYFNGMAYAHSGRHWFSLELRRFYLETHFDTLFDSPRSLAVDTISSCNYRCGKCQFNSPKIEKLESSKTIMQMDEFKRIVDICGSFKRLKSISPTITGEPLLHPKIAAIVHYVKSKDYAISFATNASLLKDDLGKNLLDAGLDSITFSVDSVNPEKYKVIQGGDLQLVEKNILSFQKNAFNKRNGSFPMSIIMVVSQNNENEVEEYRKVWIDRGFTVMFSAEHDITNRNKPYYFDSEWGPQSRMPCWVLWHGLYLTNEGRVVTCGSMAKTKGFKESIFGKSPDELWRSNTFTNLRKFQLTGNTPGYCGEFACWTGQMYTWVYKDGRLCSYTPRSKLENPFENNINSQVSDLKLTQKFRRFKRKISKLFSKDSLSY